jgi:hypothetical protein
MTRVVNYPLRVYGDFDRDEFLRREIARMKTNPPVFSPWPAVAESDTPRGRTEEDENRSDYYARLGVRT